VEIASQLANYNGATSAHLSQLGGTRVLWEALKSGRIDAYPEYTGTIYQELLPGVAPAQLKEQLAQLGIGVTEPLGFNDTYALGMLATNASQLNVQTISDLKAHPTLTL